MEGKATTTLVQPDERIIEITPFLGKCSCTYPCHHPATHIVSISDRRGLRAWKLVCSHHIEVAIQDMRNRFPKRDE